MTFTEASTVENLVRDALLRLNPEIAALPDRADDVLYKLLAIVLSVRSALLKYTLHQDQELFGKAYGYVRVYC